MNATIKKYLRVILKRWFVVVAIFLVVLVAGILVSGFLLDDQYESMGRAMLPPDINDENATDLANVAIVSFYDISLSNIVLESVAEDERVSAFGYNSKDLKLMLRIVRRGNTIEVQCVSAIKERAEILVQAYLEKGISKINSIINSSKYNLIILDKASAAEELETNNIIILIAFAGVGLILGLALAAMPLFRRKIGYDANELYELYNCPVIAEFDDENQINRKN